MIIIKYVKNTNVDYQINVAFLKNYSTFYCRVLTHGIYLLLDFWNLIIKLLPSAFYYFRAMAKMGVALSLQINNKLLLNTIPVGIASGLGATGITASQSTILHNKINKIENHYKIADSAVEDYNKALSLDHNIRIRYNNINVRTTSDFVGADFIFYRPISSKELLSLLAGNRKWWILLIPVVFWLILPFILLYFYGDTDGNLSNTGLFIEIAYTSVLIFCVLFVNNKDNNILQKYGEDIVVIEKSGK